MFEEDDRFCNLCESTVVYIKVRRRGEKRVYEVRSCCNFKCALHRSFEEDNEWIEIKDTDNR